MKFKQTLLIALATIILASCGTTSVVPITGRKQRLSYTDEQMLGLALNEYKQYTVASKLSTNAANTAMVKRVGQRLANAVNTYLTQNGFADRVSSFQWEFNLLAENQQNAFCMPGGKIVVYEGLLPVTQDEASLAIVMGHEIAHAVARHSAEQLSKQERAQTGTQLLGGVLAGVGLGDAGSLIMTGVNLGTQLTQLHGSRSNESEADYMGLIFAAMAGYDPNVAVTFWQRMASQSTGGGASFLSTHPSDEKRIADIKKHLPEALKYYQQGGVSAPATSSKSKTSKKQPTQTQGTLRIK